MQNDNKSLKHKNVTVAICSDLKKLHYVHIKEYAGHCWLDARSGIQCVKILHHQQSERFSPLHNAVCLPITRVTWKVAIEWWHVYTGGGGSKLRVSCANAF